MNATVLIQNKYGVKISTQEYDEKMRALYVDGVVPTKKEDKEMRKKELELMINHRLGVNFPLSKREQLWKVMDRVNSHRLWVGLSYLIGSYFQKNPQKLGNKLFFYLGNHLERNLLKVLDKEDCETFLKD